MKSKIFFLIIISLALFGGAQSLQAATIYAVSCEQADVQNAINSASSGDTVMVPAGSCTWTTEVTIPVDKTIKLIGAGSNNTVINVGSNTAITSWSKNSRVSGFQFYPTTEYNKSPIVGAKNHGFRIDHNWFNNTTSMKREVQGNGANTGGIEPEGVIDNNTFTNVRAIAFAAGSFDTENVAWYADSSIGTEHMVFIEDNIFDCPTGNVMDSGYGGKYVFRYNTVTGGNIMAHSLQSKRIRGTRNWEIYGNSMDLGYGYPNLGFIRGGTGIIFGNAIDFYSSYYSGIANILFDNVRSSSEKYTCCGSNPPPDTTDSGACDGTSKWDGNQGIGSASGYPCRDQIGRGKDSALFNTTTYAASTLDPAYSWSNRNISEWAVGGNSNIPVVVKAGAGDQHIIANRDYYDYVLSFNGTSGVGCGTLANRPTTCTTGVGYWVTNQSCSYLTGMVGKNPATPISGTLYKCTAPNTWTAYYTPYTYPHPLRNESAPTSDTTPPSAPTGLTVN